MYVYKEITCGASLYGHTNAIGELERARATGVMPCGNGDDYVLNREDRALVRDHDPATGDLHLPAGPMGRRRKVRPIK